MKQNTSGTDIVTNDSLKETLRDSLNDMRSQIIDSFDGKLKATERNILSAMDEKLAKQTDEIVKDVVAIVTPLFDEQDEKFLKSKPKN